MNDVGAVAGSSALCCRLAVSWEDTPMAPTTPEVLHGHTAAMWYHDRLLELMNEVYRRQDRSERRGGRRRVVHPAKYALNSKVK